MMFLWRARERSPPMREAQEWAARQHHGAKRAAQRSKCHQRGKLRHGERWDIAIYSKRLLYQQNSSVTTDTQGAGVGGTIKFIRK